jgi:hypothetical protein
VSADLLVFRGKDLQLDADQVRSVLSTIEGVRDLTSADPFGGLLECEFDFKGDSTIIRLNRDASALSLSGLGDASLWMAMELQRRLGVPLRAVDTNYSFDVSLSAFGTLDELRSAVLLAEP